MDKNAKSFSSTCTKIGLAMLLFYALFTLSTFLISFFLELYVALHEYTITEYSLEVVSSILFSASYFFSFSIPAFILIRICRRLPNARPIYKTFKFNRWIFFIIIAVVALNFTIAYLNNSIVNSFLPSVPSPLDASQGIFYEPSTNAELCVFFVLEILSTAIVPAFCEEYLFRGAILTNLLPFGKSTAIFASAFLFGFMHQNPVQMLYTMLMGIVIGYIYVKTKSIWVCIILHGVNNFITVLEEYLPKLTNIEWIALLIDLVIMICGAVALLLVLLKKNKTRTPEAEGSFGRICESGMDYEELRLDLPTGKKLKRFFRPTIIIFVAICVFNIATELLSLYGVPIVF